MKLERFKATSKAKIGKWRGVGGGEERRGGRGAEHGGVGGDAHQFSHEVTGP